MSLLKVEDIHVYYGAIHAIKGISFEVNRGRNRDADRRKRRGQIYHAEYGGPVCFARADRSYRVRRQEHRRRCPASKMVSHGMALCPEGRRIFQQMTVRENLEMGGYIQTGERRFRNRWTTCSTAFRA